MPPTAAARHSASVLRTGFATMQSLIVEQIPDSMERRNALSALHESMELAMRGALDQTDTNHPQSDR